MATRREEWLLARVMEHGKKIRAIEQALGLADCSDGRQDFSQRLDEQAAARLSHAFS